MKIQEINNTLGPHQRETLVLRKGDVGGTVHFTVPDLTGITSADFRLIKPDGTFVVKSGAIVQNTVIVQITEQMCTVYGSGIYNLELKASGVSVYTAIGRCLIDKNIDLNDYAASVAEVNGLVFPDDFLTSTDLSAYAKKTYVDTAISSIPIYTPISYSTTEQDTGLKWIDGKPIYQRTFIFNQEITIYYTTWTNLGIVNTDIDVLINAIAGDYGYGGAPNRGVTWGCIDVSKVVHNGYLSALTGRNADSIQIDCLTIRYTKTTDTV